MTRVSVIDSHTEGEPTRVVVGGWPLPSGDTMAERRATLLRAAVGRSGPMVPTQADWSLWVWLAQTHRVAPLLYQVEIEIGDVAHRPEGARTRDRSEAWMEWSDNSESFTETLEIFGRVRIRTGSGM